MLYILANGRYSKMKNKKKNVWENKILRCNHSVETYTMCFSNKVSASRVWNKNSVSGKWFIDYWKMFVMSQIRARAFDLYEWSLLSDIFIPVVLLSIPYILACRWNVRKWNIQELFSSMLRDTKVLKQCLVPNAGCFPNLTERNSGFSSYLQLKPVCLNGDHF